MMKDVMPVWGTRKAAAITRRDAVPLVDDIRLRAPVVANRLQGVLTRMFNFAAERGIIEHSPLNDMRRPPEKARDRVLNDEEIRLLWAGLDPCHKRGMFQVTRLALKMILLTGQRPGEVCGMTWDEIDGEGFWNIQADRRKGRESQRVPLSGMALDVIKQARVYSNMTPFVFTSTRGGTHIETHTASTAILHSWERMGIKEQFTPHDLRRTVRTRLAELGIDDVVAERVLGHKLQGIMGVYNRHSCDTEKRQSLEKWAKKLQQIIGIDKP